MGNTNDERRELLKLKQGLITESEIISRGKREEAPELRGFARVKNEIYHLGWVLPVIIGAVLVIVFVITQLANRPKYDIQVMIVPAAENSELLQFANNTNPAEAALAKLCPDYDENGKISVGALFIDFTESSENRTYLDMQYEKFNIEINAGESVLILADPELFDKLNEAYENEISAFVDLSDKFPEEQLYKGCGVYVSGTELAQNIGCENAVLFVRDELGNGRDEKITRIQRTRALEMIEIIKGRKKD